MSLIEIVTKKCRDHGIRVLLMPTEEVLYPNTSDKWYLGYFIVDPEGETAVLCCAMLNPQWEEVLMHEFNHALQWIEKSPAWDAPKLTTEEALLYGVQPGQETLDVIHRWMEGHIEIPPEELTGLVNRSIEVELDCEKRTAAMGLELYEDWQLYHHGEYVKLCNAYLRSYKYTEQTRSKCSYGAECVLAVMPPTFTLDYYAPLTETEKAAFAASLDS